MNLVLLVSSFANLGWDPGATKRVNSFIQGRGTKSKFITDEKQVWLIRNAMQARQRRECRSRHQPAASAAGDLSLVLDNENTY